MWCGAVNRTEPHRTYRKNGTVKNPAKNDSTPSQTQFVIPLCLPNQTSTIQAMTSLRSSIAVYPSLLPAWGLGAAPAHAGYPKIDSPLAGAGNTSLPLAAALRGGRVPSLVSLVTNGCFLTSCVIRFFCRIQYRSFVDRTPRRTFLEYVFNYEIDNCISR